MWLAGSSDRPIPVTLLMSRSWYWGPSENQMILVLPIFVSGELKHFHHHPHSGGDGRTICIQIQPVFSPANVLSLRALHHESILWEVYHQKKPHLFIPFCLKIEFARNSRDEKLTLVTCHQPPAFSTQLFRQRSSLWEEEEDLLFLFSLFLSANVVCSWLCPSIQQSWLYSDKVYMFLEIKNEKCWEQIFCNKNSQDEVLNFEPAS